jgi:4-amino-4-deoxy-L-arabinose transferase-like glycosyltransferase
MLRSVWAGRLALLGIAAVAAFSYAWRAATPVNIESYYAAAARSMSLNFHNFVFAAFDPVGTVSTDKLPGALWVQALSVRIFGPHLWALVLPQVIEGTATVLLLYRAVSRLAGTGAGLAAAGVLALSPATVSLNRGNVPDTLMILLLVLAADSVSAAVVNGRLRPLLLAGLWTGLAFQAKMIEAWLVLPAFGVCYLVAGAGSLAARLRRVTSLGLVTAVVSVSWMTLVAVIPAWVRPYTDGSPNNSVFYQVFVYDGFGRFGQASPDQLLDRSIRLGIPTPPAPGADRLLTGALGRDTGWLLAAAAVALVAGLLATRRRPRQEPVRACWLLWGIWLAVLGATFSVTPFINTYYTAALSPAIAALIGTGAALAWQHRDRGWTWLALGAAVAATAVYGAWLLPPSGTGMPPWLKPALLGLAVAALAGVAALRWRAWPGVMLCGLAVLLVPAVASASVASSGLGPFETPFEPVSVTTAATRFFGAGLEVGGVLPVLESANRGTPYLMATQTSVVAAPFIWATGQEVLPVGGFTGTIPEPSLNVLQNYIELNDVHTFVQSSFTTDPRLRWIARHCIAVKATPGAATALPLSVYYCPGWIFLR